MDHMDGVRGGRDASIFWRDSYRKSHNGYEHSLMTSSEKILEYVNSTTMRQEHKEGYDTMMRFGETSAAEGGEEAGHLNVHFSNYKSTDFYYDKDTGMYDVNQFGVPITDKYDDNEVNLAVKNVIVMHTSARVIDDYGRMRYETTGSGTANYYCEGRCIPIEWSRGTRNDPFRVTVDGELLSFMPGETYICVINPKASSEKATALEE
ncbi:MAG: DUF3048 C-terminal domain-containing protein [Bacteroidales bacterium]|nr:DUF3048 C-terminal domain-containing protein [Bacteroidales bacterium]